MSVEENYFIMYDASNEMSTEAKLEVMRHVNWALMSFEQGDYFRCKRQLEFAYSVFLDRQTTFMPCNITAGLFNAETSKPSRYIMNAMTSLSINNHRGVSDSFVDTLNWLWGELE